MLAVIGSACSLSNASTASNAAPKPGPGDYPLCADVSVDVGMMATYGMLFGPELGQLNSDASAAGDARLRRDAQDVPGPDGPFNGPQGPSKALGEMASVCTEFGLYRPEAPPTASPTTSYPMPIGPSPTG